MDLNKRYTLVVHGSENTGEAILTRKDVKVHDLNNPNYLEFTTNKGRDLVLINCQNVIIMEGQDQ